MAIKNRIFKNNTEKMGVTGDIICPSCENNVNMSIFRNYDSFNIIASIKGEKQSVGIAVCPRCAAVFSVNPDYIQAINEGRTVYLTPDDLTRLK